MESVLNSGYFLPLRLSVIAVMVLFSCVQTTRADVYGKIQGTVIDPAGAVLTGVQLTATNLGTSISYTTASSGDGTFVFLNLPIGTYRVTATSSGFRTFTATGITLTVDQVRSEERRVGKERSSE